jgi:hypothetical protein
MLVDYKSFPFVTRSAGKPPRGSSPGIFVSAKLFRQPGIASARSFWVTNRATCGQASEKRFRFPQKEEGHFRIAATRPPSEIRRFWLEASAGMDAWDGLERSEETMAINCRRVWRDVSDYIDDELSPAQRPAFERHFAECRNCAVLLDGMLNVIAICRDERVLAPPDGFHERLYQRLEKETKEAKSSRRTFLAWTFAAAAAVPLAFAAFSAGKLVLRGHDAQTPASAPDMGEGPGTVAISEDHNDKIYHVPGCPHLIGKPKLLAVKEAIREGYTPDAYCIAKAKPKKTG